MTGKELIRQLLNEDLDNEVKIIVWDRELALNRQEQVMIDVDGIWNQSPKFTIVILGKE